MRGADRFRTENRSYAARRQHAFLVALNSAMLRAGCWRSARSSASTGERSPAQTPGCSCSTRNSPPGPVLGSVTRGNGASSNSMPAAPLRHRPIGTRPASKERVVKLRQEMSAGRPAGSCSCARSELFVGAGTCEEVDKIRGRSARSRTVPGRTRTRAWPGGWDIRPAGSSKPEQRRAVTAAVHGRGA